MRNWDAILIHCLWSNGSITKCTQDFKIFKMILENGLNIYPLMPLKLIIKNKMYQSVKKNIQNEALKPSLLDCVNFDVRNLHLDFCKNDNEVGKFINGIKKERYQLAQELELIESYNLLNENQDEIIKYAHNLANSFENFDLNERSENDSFIFMICPPPKARFSRRYKNGSYKEEIDFIEYCNKIDEEVTAKETDPNNTNRAGSKEVRDEWKDIHEKMKIEFNSRPIDLAFNDWIAQQKGKPMKLRLSQMAQSIRELEFDPFTGDLELETKEVEDQLKNSIAENLMKLNRIQDEKLCLQTRKIPMDLVNENCFPEMAEILAEAEKSNKNMDIFSVSDSDTDLESWTDSWSSD